MPSRGTATRRGPAAIRQRAPPGKGTDRSGSASPGGRGLASAASDTSDTCDEWGRAHGRLGGRDSAALWAPGGPRRSGGPLWAGCHWDSGAQRRREVNPYQGPGDGHAAQRRHGALRPVADAGPGNPGAAPARVCAPAVHALRAHGRPRIFGLRRRDEGPRAPRRRRGGGGRAGGRGLGRGRPRPHPLLLRRHAAAPGGGPGPAGPARSPHPGRTHRGTGSRGARPAQNVAGHPGRARHRPAVHPHRVRPGGLGGPGAGAGRRPRLESREPPRFGRARPRPRARRGTRPARVARPRSRVGPAARRGAALGCLGAPAARRGAGAHGARRAPRPGGGHAITGRWLPRALADGRARA